MEFTGVWKKNYSKQLKGNQWWEKIFGGKFLSVGSLKRAPQGVFEMCKVFCYSV